ncbi:MAG: hypothetical protein LBL50_03665, partial [Candidatus Margulisbacteria bacterium]|nr:hypothetical protein [Candidatus Margulisiibacteriota bacterium]
SLTILALGLTLAGCGKTASGGGSSGGGGNSYQRTSDTVETLEGLLNALETVDDVIIPADTTITIDATVTINAGKNLIVAEDAILNVSDNVRPVLEGTIIVKEGAVLVDYGAYHRATLELYGPWQTNDEASIVYETGAQGYRYVPGAGLILFLGTADDTAVYQLTDGEVVLKKAAFELNGDVNVAGVGQPVVLNESPDTKVVINEGATVTVVNGATLTLDRSKSDGGSTIKLNGSMVIKSGGILKDTKDSGGTIWSGNGSGSLTYEYGSTGYLDNDKMIGDDGLIKLNSGATFTLYKDKYVVAGQITIQNDFIAPTLVEGETGAKITVSAGKTVLLEGNGNLSLNGGNTYEWNGSTWVEENP